MVVPKVLVLIVSVILIAIGAIMLDFDTDIGKDYEEELKQSQRRLDSLQVYADSALRLNHIYETKLSVLKEAINEADSTILILNERYEKSKIFADTATASELERFFNDRYNGNHQ